MESDIDEENRYNEIFIPDQIPVVYVEYEEEVIVDEDNDEMETTEWKISLYLKSQSWHCKWRPPTHLQCHDLKINLELLNLFDTVSGYLQ